MEMQGTRTIAADRATVWAALNDPDILMASIPGCTELEKLSETELQATVVAKVGPVKATFRGAVELRDLNPPESYTLAGEGKGGVAGFAKGSAKVTLAEVAEGTELAYAAEAKVGGKLAQLGSRIVDGYARRMADEFFDNFRTAIEGPPEEDAAAGPEAAPAADSAPEAAAGGSSDGALLPGEPGGEGGGRKGILKRLFG